MGSDRRAVFGAVVLVLTIQYLVVEQVVARSWSDPGYRWTRNYVSHLGAVDCGPEVCSPDHAMMNASMVMHACLLLLGVVMLSGLIASRPLRLAVRMLFGFNAVGNLVVASFPVQPRGLAADHLHHLGAGLATVGGLAGVAVVGVASLRTPHRRTFGAFSLVCAGVAVVGLVLLQATTDDELPPGLLERLAIDPVIVWCVVTGMLLARRSVRTGPLAIGNRLVALGTGRRRGFRTAGSTSTAPRRGYRAAGPPRRGRVVGSARRTRTPGRRS